MRINLHVERVVLHGVAVSSGQRADLIRALEQELASQLAAAPPMHWFEGDASVAALPPVPIRLPASPSPTATRPKSPSRAMVTGIAGGVTDALTTGWTSRP